MKNILNTSACEVAIIEASEAYKKALDNMADVKEWDDMATEENRRYVNEFNGNSLIQMYSFEAIAEFKTALSYWIDAVSKRNAAVAMVQWNLSLFCSGYSGELHEKYIRDGNELYEVLTREVDQAIGFDYEFAKKATNLLVGLIKDQSISEE